MINTINLIRRDVPSLSIDDSVSRAINLMVTHNIKQIPVFDLNNRYCGMLY
ncbi:MAG: CBS domain-containing protein, partial [Candidatus Nitrosocosmicus sp.]